MAFSRDKKSILNSWWWTVDKWLVLAVICIMAMGVILVASGSPSVADKIDISSNYFIKRQLAFVCMSLAIIFITSLMPPVLLRRLSILAFIVFTILMILVLGLGEEIKGARRWFNIFGITLQPSEFMKPIFVIITAMVLSNTTARNDNRNFTISMALYAVVAFLLIRQPDFGMTTVVTAVWTGQLLIAGLPWSWVLTIIIAGMIGAVFAYLFLPHVAYRINSFLDMSDSGNYQVQKSLEAFQNGGIFGVGPGEGVVKLNLPDSHTDFIFAVAGEELGAIATLAIVSLYAFVVVRGFKRLQTEHNLFIIYATSGLLILFGLQAMINMGVALRLLPTKGMTLPFISYGGSSMLALSVAIGMILAFTRKRYGQILSKSQSSILRRG